MNGLYRIMVISLIVLLSLPGLQYLTGVFKLKPLNGVINEPHIIPLTFENYLSFDYQTSVLNYIDRHFGFRPFFIRLYNQVDYSFFNIPHGLGTTIGIDGYLYEKWYIEDYLGYYFIGQSKIKKKVSQLSDIRHFLKQYNTELMVILAPGKGWYYPEYIPDYHIRKREQTNYTFFAEAFLNSDVPVLDANGWFMDLKDSIPYPLFTKTGTHWSEYGAKMVCDSLLGQCEVLLKRKMNQIHLKNVEWSTEPRKTDNDLEKLLNLFIPISKPPMAYPIFNRENRIPKEQRPSVIVIGDSFYWNMYDGTLGNSFLTNQYWYYYNSIWPFREGIQLTTKEIDIIEAIAETDLVILITSTAGLHKIGHGFIEDIWPVANDYCEVEKMSLIEEFTSNISNSERMMKIIREKALKRNISVDSMIYLDANYLAEKKMDRSK